MLESAQGHFAADAKLFELAGVLSLRKLPKAGHHFRVRRALPRLALAGCVLAVSGLALLWGHDGLGTAFIGLFALLLGLALLTPGATVVLMRVLTPLAGLLFGQMGRMAGRGSVATLSRTGVAVAALMMAVSVAVGVDLMIRSFRTTVQDWLEYSLPADLYVSSTAGSNRGLSGPVSGFEAAVAARLRRLPGVEGVNTVRQADALGETGRVRLMAYELTAQGRSSIGFTQPAASSRWPEIDSGTAVFVSEPLAFRQSLTTGSTLRLSTPSGRRSFEVAGVYYDYASERGAVLMHSSIYRELWRDDRLTALSIEAAPGTDLDELADRVRQAMATDRAFVVRSNHSLRAASLRVFDRTFLVTDVLRLLAVAVAFIGVLSALTALQLERGRELGILRAYGLTPGQLWRLVVSQTGLLGLAAGLLSIPVGVLMAAIMVYVINRRSFGWTLTLQVAPESLAGALLIAVGAALLAGLYPAFKMASTRPDEALRRE